MGLLEGKVAVITGASRGLGFSIARRYAQEGAAVIIAARTADAVQVAVNELRAEGLKVSGLPCDVGNQDQVKALADHAIAEFSRIDIWVNNAGVAGVYGPTGDVPAYAFERVVRTNILGTYYGSMIALRNFLKQGSGKLINLLGRGDTGPVAYQNAYAPSKIWVLSFTRALAKEYKKAGIGIYAFNPGLVDTDMLRRVEVVAGHERKLNPLRTIIRMWAKPPELPAQKALYLASPATDGKTGLVVKVLDRRILFGGLISELGMRLRGKGPDVSLDMVSIPSALDEAMPSKS